MAQSWPARVCAPCGGPARATQAASTGRAAMPRVSSRARACPGARAVRGSALPTCAPVSRRARSSGSTCGPCDPSPTARSCRSPGSRSRTSREGRAGVSVVWTPCARRARSAAAASDIREASRRNCVHCNFTLNPSYGSCGEVFARRCRPAREQAAHATARLRATRSRRASRRRAASSPGIWSPRPK